MIELIDLTVVERPSHRSSQNCRFGNFFSSSIMANVVFDSVDALTFVTLQKTTALME